MSRCQKLCWSQDRWCLLFLLYWQGLLPCHRRKLDMIYTWHIHVGCLFFLFLLLGACTLLDYILIKWMLNLFDYIKDPVSCMCLECKVALKTNHFNYVYPDQRQNYCMRFCGHHWRCRFPHPHLIEFALSWGSAVTLKFLPYFHHLSWQLFSKESHGKCLPSESTGFSQSNQGVFFN